MNDHRREREEVATQVLASAPKLTRDDRFQFDCNPGISCFNVCCADVNIVLTPLDIVRMSRRLGLSTTDFLARHSLVPFSDEQKLPFGFLKMSDNEKRSCPFVTEKGCGIYADRPWPCRMYPIGEASPENKAVQGEGFFFLMQEGHCRGHEEKQTWTIGDWLHDQSVAEYAAIGELFKQIILHPYLAQKPLDPARMEMFYMACYDLDRFRDFVLTSKFLDRFDLSPETVEALRRDDMELMRFAFRWLRFALFGEMTITIRPELLNQRERDLLAQKK
jgi:uncharacterized protein